MSKEERSASGGRRRDCGEPEEGRESFSESFREVEQMKRDIEAYEKKKKTQRRY